MSEALQFGIVTGLAGLALAALVLPFVRRRSRPAGPPTPACAKCASQTRRRA